MSSAEYSATLKADVICRGYVGIPQSVWDPEKTGRTFSRTVNQGGTANRSRSFVLDRAWQHALSGTFLLRENEPCTAARSAERELAPRRCRIEEAVYGEAATSTVAKQPEMRHG